jgi:cysteinyl-tRNA synthetase
MPTHDAEGVEITKVKRKKLAKERDAQRKLHDAYLKSIAN